MRGLWKRSFIRGSGRYAGARCTAIGMDLAFYMITQHWRAIGYGMLVLIGGLTVAGIIQKTKTIADTSVATYRAEFNPVTFCPKSNPIPIDEWEQWQGKACIAWYKAGAPKGRK